MSEKQTNQIEELVLSSGLEEQTAVNIKDKFLPFFEQAEQWRKKAESLVVTSIDQKEEMQEARKARIALKDIRVNADKTRKALKEDSLRYGKAVQGVYNVIEYLVVPIEKYLEEQEKFAERAEAKRVSDLQELRHSEAQKYFEFVPANMNLGLLSEDEYSKLITGAKLQQEAKEKAEKEAEAERLRLHIIEALRQKRSSELMPYSFIIKASLIGIELGEIEEDAYLKILNGAKADKIAHEKEQERIKSENEALRKKNEEAEAKIIKERKEAEDKAASERKEQEAKLAKEKAEKEKLQAEIKAKEDRELQQKRDAELLEKKAKAAPDKEKLKALKNTILNIDMPNLTTPEAKKIVNSINVLLGKVCTYIDEKVIGL